MPKDLTKMEVNTGKVVFEWLVKEYERYDRGHRWYWFMFGGGVFLVIYSLVTANYLFALIVILFGIVLYVHEMQEPLEVYFALTESGIIIGRRFYKYSELEGFWVIYNPPEVKNLYFRLKKLFQYRLKVPLLDYDPRPIKEYLSQFVTEETEHEEEPVSDRLARIFKIH